MINTGGGPFFHVGIEWAPNLLFPKCQSRDSLRNMNCQQVVPCGSFSHEPGASGALRSLLPTTGIFLILAGTQGASNVSQTEADHNKLTLIQHSSSGSKPFLLSCSWKSCPGWCHQIGQWREAHWVLCQPEPGSFTCRENQDACLRHIGAINPAMFSNHSRGVP